MNRLDKLMKQEILEKGIAQKLAAVDKEDGRINKQMNPKFVACSELDHTITIEFPVLEWQLNLHNGMHGGVIAAAFDEALGIFANFLSEENPSVTGNLAVNYLKPVPQEDSLMITAKVTSLGRKLITLSGEGRLKNSGLLTNTAMATYVILR